MQRPVPAEEISALECKHAVYCRARDGSKDDLLVVKENIHTKDGRVIPHLQFIKNYKRDFYITKPGFRKHQSKKEWEDTHKLQKFTTTQARMIDDIGRALGKPGLRGSLKQIARNPYIYGTDISTPALLKHKYRSAYPNAISNNTVAVIDIETDVVEGHQRPIYVAITFRDKAFIAVTKEFIGNMSDAANKLVAKANDLLSEYVEQRGIKIEAMVCENAGEACWEALQRAHAWGPDFLTAWNKDFDIPRIAGALEEFGYDTADAFSDPSVPQRFRFFNYRQGPSQKTTASGLVVPIHPADRWHVTECPARFYVIDSMCLYKRIRLAEQNDPSYSLDFQLDQHLGVRKLRFKEAENYSKLEWHKFMQTHYKIEYGVYNLFDCIGVELFDEKVKDLAQTINVQAGVSEYSIFSSQPRRLVDQLYFFCLERGKVVASCSDEMKEELDSFVVSKRDWIVTLPSHLRVANGLKIINELPDITSECYVHVADLDVASGLTN